MAPRISLCMIVRDEEACLAQCLASAANVVDEIVVVDTGSQDQTAAIARSFGATVVQETWEENFAKHRNTSLNHARGEWILVLDADETLARESIPAVTALTAQKNVLGYRVLIRIDPEWSDMRSLRLFRNSSAIRYKGIFHEELTIPPENFSCIADADIRILHTVYSRDIFNRKLSRNIALLTKHLSLYPEDLYQMLDLMRIYLETDDIIMAHTIHEKASVLIAQPLRHYSEFKRTVCREFYYAQTIRLFNKENRPAPDILAVCSKAAAAFPECPLFIYEAARAHYKLKSYDTALACFKRCLALGKQKRCSASISYPLDLTSAKALTGMGHCYFKKRAYTQAARCLESSVLLKNDPSAQAMLVAARALIKKHAVHT